jgi:hypothetical protein
MKIKLSNNQTRKAKGLRETLRITRNFKIYYVEYINSLGIWTVEDWTGAYIWWAEVTE